jgi:hypothetical protein
MALGVALLTTALGLAACQPAKPNVILYGDSLGSQAAPFFQYFGSYSGKATITTHTYPTTAPCDWFSQMRSDAANVHPQAVVLEFAGNSLTSCTPGPGAPEQTILSSYASWMRQAIAIFGSSTHVYLGTIPESPPVAHASTATADQSAPSNQPVPSVAAPAPSAIDELNALYASLVQPGVTLANAAPSVELANGAWTLTLPCFSFEACNGPPPGRNLVRNPVDGFHLCPVAPTSPPFSCPTYASGALRYGIALLGPAQHDFAF